MLPGSRSTRTLETRKQVYESRRFRSYSISKDEYSTLNAFVHEPEFLSVSRILLPRQSSQPPNRSFILCLLGKHKIKLQKLFGNHPTSLLGDFLLSTGGWKYAEE